MRCLPPADRPAMTAKGAYNVAVGHRLELGAA